ncbi:MAG TPA: UDP-N-acetylmuramoyl-tripeptide--D-alanyl-D-alanine ligase [Vicinamibacterales bacterium]|nr:UDP-N-acetylmuramoyl-tripeptide--D-alanyl-D-alanine ligase [Vicinamibacterales bacterium]
MEALALTGGDLAATTGGRIEQGDPQRRIERLSIDSRTIADGDFFVALRGERYDGHRFVADALERGAIGVMVEEVQAGLDSSMRSIVAPGQSEGEAGTVRPAPLVVQVADTTRALQNVARDIRRRSAARVVAITGSAGKTTTKEVAAEFLAARYRVFRNQGNLNNHIGLPLSLFELRTKPDVAVVELGMNHPGEIRTLVGIAEPDVRVWTNVGDAHLGFFASADAIADAKAEILEQAGPNDTLIANANDPRITARIGAFAGRVMTFGIEVDADVQAVDVTTRGLEGTGARVRTPAGELRIDTPLLGLGNLANVLAATAVAVHFGVPLAEIARRAAALKPPYHRGELLRLPGGITLIDDSYNSSPSALKRALETVAAATGSARKAAVLGEMLELGAHSERLHEECGRAAAAAGLDFLITVGGAPAQAMGRAAVSAGMPSHAVLHAGTSDEAAELALARLRPGDLVLVKGSRGIGTDRVVERLKAEFA